MDLYILNSNYIPVAVIDSYKSLIWTTRYYTYGDFELYVPADKNLLDYLKQDYFVIREDDSSVMIIEKIEITTSVEEGDFFIISGRSLESILTRRIIWEQTNLSTTVTDGINQLITQNMMTYGRRYISNMSIDTSFSKSNTLNVQFTGDNLMDAIGEICTQFEIGFRITLNNGQFIFSCYEGEEVDVTFSPEFDNLINSDYSSDMMSYANVALVAGEGQGINRTTAEIWTTPDVPDGLNRREIYVDARDISSNDGAIPSITYREKLLQRGEEKLLSEHPLTKSFEGEIEPNMTYEYKRDYNLGDVVTVVNEYGISAKPRIVEIIENWDETGYTVIPTFEEWEV